MRYHWVVSEGDRVTDRALAAVGGKALFTKAIDDAVLSGKADLAVHSLKDVPGEMPGGLTLAATPRRGKVEDVLIAPPGVRSLERLPAGATVGTSSPRRAAQMRRLIPKVRIALLRGNVQTRLDAVADPSLPCDATLLAAAGLHRLGLREHLRILLPVEQVMPAVAQGALGLICRRDDHVTLTRCLPLNSAPTNTAVTAEREFVSLLGAGCHSPVAVLAEPVDPKLTRAKRNADSHYFRLRARVISVDGARCLEADERCKTGELRRVVRRVAARLIDEGAREILAEAERVELFDDAATRSSASSVMQSAG